MFLDLQAPLRLLSRQSNKLLQSMIARMGMRPLSIRQNSYHYPYTTLFVCLLPSPEHLDMHWLQPQK